jgi:adenosylmethionine-8-amino-7-oxononanoate aminotransferase
MPATRADTVKALKRAAAAYLASEPSSDLQIVRSDGNHVVDVHRRKYIDFTMGWCVGNLGWGNSDLRERIQRFETPDYVRPDSLYRPWVELAKLLARVTPGRLHKSIRATGGTEAVDIALQLAIAHTGRHGFVTIAEAYHGNSLATRCVVDPEFANRNKLLSSCHTISPPLDDKAADKVETLLKRRDIAAVLMEPIVCNLAVVIPTSSFMRRVRELCDRHGTVLIFDEVATGFGRTGKMFAAEHFDVEPDILCLAKAITAGLAPMGATVVTDDVAATMREQELEFYSTYGWHPLSAEVALAAIRYMVAHEKVLLENAEARGRQIGERLLRLPFPSPADVRVCGLAIGVELASEGYAEKFAARCRRAGLLISADESTLSMFPALDVDAATTQHALDIMEACV